MMIQTWIEICRLRIKSSKKLDRKLFGNCSDGKMNKNKYNSEIVGTVITVNNTTRITLPTISHYTMGMANLKTAVLEVLKYNRKLDISEHFSFSI